jgi:hypothetical protein
MRESERQRDEATRYARTVLSDKKSLEERLTKLDTGYVSEMENRITSGLEAAKGKLTTAREAGNITDEVDAQKEIAKLGYEEARLAEMKINQEPKNRKKKRRVNLINKLIFDKDSLQDRNQMREQLNGQRKTSGLAVIMP